MSSPTLPRRDFLATGIGLATAAMSRRTYARGANDRIGIGIVGCGSRGTYLLNEVFTAAPDQVNIVAISDVWSGAREKFAAGAAEKFPGHTPRMVGHYQDLLDTEGLDAVIIATPDFAHPAVLIDTVRAGKDAYVEKPLSARLEDAAAALDAVEASDRIVQVGTQRRSSLKFQAAAAYIQSGALGDICKIETAWNRNIASWDRPAPMTLSDVDWDQYQMYLPRREFDARRYRCWQLYYEYTTGLVGLLGSHMIDVALWFMNDPFPTSAVALGGNLTWKDGREISDTAEYVFEFPKGWILTFSSRLGSGPEVDYEIFRGKERVLDSRDWIARDASNKNTGGPDVPVPEIPGVERSHMGNWLDCVRSRQKPNAPIQAGYAHAVACCLGREAERTGRRVRYDQASRKILDT